MYIILSVEMSDVDARVTDRHTQEKYCNTPAHAHRGLNIHVRVTHEHVHVHVYTCMPQQLMYNF